MASNLSAEKKVFAMRGRNFEPGTSGMSDATYKPVLFVTVTTVWDCTSVEMRPVTRPMSIGKHEAAAEWYRQAKNYTQHYFRQKSGIIVTSEFVWTCAHDSAEACSVCHPITAVVNVSCLCSIRLDLWFPVASAHIPLLCNNYLGYD
jgi:hypothetical protein